MGKTKNENVDEKIHTHTHTHREREDLCICITYLEKKVVCLGLSYHQCNVFFYARFSDQNPSFAYPKTRYNSNHDILFSSRALRIYSYLNLIFSFFSLFLFCGANDLLYAFLNCSSLLCTSDLFLFSSFILASASIAIHCPLDKIHHCCYCWCCCNKIFRFF